ncbi:MAG: outer membrane beta-barrel protein [Bradyrhizobium sp.]
MDTSTLAVPPLFTDTATSKMNGVSGGAQIGYNLQMQSWLVGLEGDIQATGQRSNHSYTCPAGFCSQALILGLFLVPNPAVAVTETQRIDFYGTVRGRVGVTVVPTVLLYATGGLAYGQVDTESTLPNSARSQNYKVGWTAGGGIEGAIGGNWTLRVEYLYLDLGRTSGTFASNLTDATRRGSARQRLQFTHHRQHRASRRELQVWRYSDRQVLSRGRRRMASRSRSWFTAAKSKLG